MWNKTPTEYFMGGTLSLNSCYTCTLSLSPFEYMQRSEVTSVVEETTVSWHRVQSSEDIYYESASTGDYLLLNLNHSMTGLLEITVTFSSGDFEKSSAVEYFGNILQYISCVSFSIQLKVC